MWLQPKNLIWNAIENQPGPSIFFRTRKIEFYNQKTFSFYVRWLLLFIFTNLYKLKIKTNSFISYLYFSHFNRQKLISYVININLYLQINQKLLKEFFCMLYFQSHLLKQFYRPYQIIICINGSTDWKFLNLLNILNRKYSFFKLRQSESQNINVGLEQNYFLGSNLDKKISMSDTCLLIGVNPRYEGSKRNLKLRSRYLKGNFEVIQIGSLINLTFSNTNITNNIKILKSLIGRNNLFCQNFVHSSNPILISNAEIFKRKDSFVLTNILKNLTKYINLFSQSGSQNRLSILNPSLNSVGFANFNSLKTIKSKDLKNATGIYFINNSFSTSNVKKLLNFKLLNFFQDYTCTNKILITQNSNLDMKLIAQMKEGFRFKTNVHLPNNVFFESSGAYLNTEGRANKVTKIINPSGQTKNDWQIIRKLFSYSKKFLFITNFFKTDKWNFNAICHFTFLDLQNFRQPKAITTILRAFFSPKSKNAVLHVLPGTGLELHGDIACRVASCFDFLCYRWAKAQESLRNNSFLNDTLVENTFLDGNLDELMGASIYIFLLYALIVAPWHALLFDVSEESSSSESGNGNESDNDGANDGGNVPPRPGAVAVSLALATMANEADLPNSVAVAESWTRYEKAWDAAQVARAAFYDANIAFRGGVAAVRHASADTFLLAGTREWLPSAVALERLYLDAESLEETAHAAIVNWTAAQENLTRLADVAATAVWTATNIANSTTAGAFDAVQLAAINGELVDATQSAAIHEAVAEASENRLDDFYQVFGYDARYGGLMGERVAYLVADAVDGVVNLRDYRAGLYGVPAVVPANPAVVPVVGICAEDVSSIGSSYSMDVSITSGGYFGDLGSAGSHDSGSSLGSWGSLGSEGISDIGNTMDIERACSVANNDVCMGESAAAGTHDASSVDSGYVSDYDSTGSPGSLSWRSAGTGRRGGAT